MDGGRAVPTIPRPSLSCLVFSKSLIFSEFIINIHPAAKIIIQGKLKWHSSPEIVGKIQKYFFKVPGNPKIKSVFSGLDGRRHFGSVKYYSTSPANLSHTAAAEL